jgi:hypothetical protein
VVVVVLLLLLLLLLLHWPPLGHSAINNSASACARTEDHYTHWPLGHSAL